MAFLGGLGKAPTFLVPIINPPFADNSPHFPPGGLLHQIRNITGGSPGFFRSAGALPGRALFQTGLTIRPAVSLMILKAAAAVIAEGSRAGFSSTTSRPTMLPLSAWMTWTAWRVESPPGS